MLRDGQRGRRIARALIALAVIYGLVAVFMWVAQPGFMGDGLYEPWYVTALPFAGVASYFIGLGWMVCIYRAHSEPGERTWRYRDF
jgi:hypothetical protein